MDSFPTHIIRRQTLEFRGVREDDARQLQEEISSLFREEILPMLDRYMSEFSPADVRHRIERLEIDLGTVFRHRLGEDFIKKLNRRLEIYFQTQQSSGSDFIAEKVEIPVEKSHREIFQFFIETGNLPWWAEFKDRDPIEKSLDFLIQNDESALRHMMYKWVRQTDVLKRIVIQTGFPKWAELAAINMDCTAEELTSMISRLMDFLKKITPWNEYSIYKLHQILGLKLLPWIYLSPHKKQNTEDLWNSFLIQMITVQPGKNDDLFLWKNKTPTDSLQANLFERIKRLLEFKLTTDKHIRWLEYLQKLNEQVFGEKDLRAILRQLEQEIINTSDNVKNNIQNDINNIREVSVSAETTNLSETNDRNESLNLVEKENNQFSDIDELFVSNAGLVILSPFFIRFFENLNLLDERRFANAAAAHRAVGLLQFLADGREVPAEHQCGLNKILCGLDAETVLEFGEPVTAEEAEACQILLEAVIANAQILGEMSVQGFRGSFLNRKGILRASAGAWHLNVERETYDVVLERFPWNWNLVKLPWMEWAISVEWL
jgi:hypothetical protein